MAECGGCSHSSGAIDRAFRRVLWAALIVNAAMFALEVVAGQLADSMSLQADALDFLGDAANYGITLFALGIGAAARAKAALFKAATMGLFGLWVLVGAGLHALTGEMPEPLIMGPVAIVALLANVGVTVLLFRHRAGDSNRRSIWLCSRNDAIANVAVLMAAIGVHATASAWPDLIVAVAIAALNLTAAWQVVEQALRELRHRRAGAAAE